jgi:uncharacterized membrane protein
MMTEAQHPLVTDYLRRLREATATLPTAAAAELVADIEEHLDAANLESRSEADVRQALDRLGSPEELTAAAGSDLPPHSSPDAPLIAGSTPAAGTHRLESAALLLLVLAEVVFIVVPLSVPLWIAGVVCLALATSWTAREKMAAAAFVATGFPVVGLGLVSAGLLAVERGCSATATSAGDGSEICTTTTSPLGVVLPALLVAYVVAQVVVIRRLLRSLR